MKHAEIISRKSPKSRLLEWTDDQQVIVSERNYSRKEQEAFRREKDKWILQIRGTRFFLADSDSGEDATGEYCGYLELTERNAVFEKGNLVGFYLFPGSLIYEGISRNSFDITSYGYPGYDVFKRESASSREAHLFLFAQPGSHHWKDWTLLRKEPGKQYRDYLDF